MGKEKIEVRLTAFEKLELVRSELAKKKQELVEIERKIRDILARQENLNYLKQLSSYYATQPAPEEVGLVPQLEAKRALIYSAIDALGAVLPQLEAAAASGKPAASTSVGGAIAQPTKKDSGRSYSDIRKKFLGNNR